jgi:N6-adenosine-specific RNA methylase IME4
MNKTLVIDKEFKGLIPPLTNEEFNQLEQNCIKDGILESIKVWQNVIIDGHNRHEIANKNGLDFTITELSFENRTDAIEWIILHQLGRRNLTEEQKAYLRGKRYENEKLKGTTLNQYTKSAEGQNVLQQKTAEKLASEYGVSDKTIKRDADFAKGVDLLPEEKRSDVLSGKSELKKQEVQQIGKIRQQAEKQVKSDTNMRSEEDIQAEIEIKAKELAAKEIRRIEEETRQKKEQKIEQKRQERDVKNAEIMKIIESGKLEHVEEFEIVLADPPWRYDFSETECRKIENNYPTATIEDICSHAPKTTPDSILFLWATAPKLREAMQVVEAWGFTYKTHAIWDKCKIGMGYWFRGQHELLIVATKGNASPPIAENRVSSIFKEVRTEHSKKPDCVYEWIESAFVSYKKLEMYARSNRPGWKSWGAEA